MGLLSSTHAPVESKTERNEQINVPFLLQPHCTAFCYMHAYIKDDSDDMIINDLTYKKFTIRNIVDPTRVLRPESELQPGLSECMVIGYHWNLAVLQIFYRDCTQFSVCNLTELHVIFTFKLCPCFKENTNLCEAYFSEDKQYLILKLNGAYLQVKDSITSQAAHSYNFTKQDCLQRLSNSDSCYTYTSNPKGGILVSRSRSNCTSDMERFNACRYEDKRICNEQQKGVWFPAFSDIRYYDYNGRPLFDKWSFRHNTYCYFHEMTNPVICKLNLKDSAFRPIANLFVPLEIFSPCREEYNSLFSINILDNVIKCIFEEYKLKYKWRYVSKPHSQWVGSRLYLEGQTIHIPKTQDNARETLKTLYTLCGDRITDLVLPEDIDALPLPKAIKESLLYRWEMLETDECLADKWEHIQRGPSDQIW